MKQYRICEENIQFKILELHITGYELVSNCYTSFEMLETDHLLSFGSIFAQCWPIIYEISGILHLNISLTVKYHLIPNLYVVLRY